MNKKQNIFSQNTRNSKNRIDLNWIQNYSTNDCRLPTNGRSFRLKLQIISMFVNKMCFEMCFEFSDNFWFDFKLNFKPIFNWIKNYFELSIKSLKSIKSIKSIDSLISFMCKVGVSLVIASLLIEIVLIILILWFQLKLSTNWSIDQT